MISENNIDKRFVNRYKFYRILYILLFLSVFAVFVFSPLLALIYTITLIASIYFIGFLVFRRQANFNCIKCGICCCLKVKPGEKDIRKIEKNLKKDRSFFLEDGKLKQVNGYCMFLKNKSKENVCSIYKFRPENCKRWPFRTFRWRWFALCPSVRSLLKKDK